MGDGECEFFIFSEDRVKSVCQQISFGKKRVPLADESSFLLLESVIVAFDV